MDELPIAAIKNYAQLHPKLPGVVYAYGTAGFRTTSTVLDSVLFRVGILAAIRSKILSSKTIGVMITASHNPEGDNGVKLVDPRGEMLEQSWEAHATALANAESTDDFIEALGALCQKYSVDLSRPAHVIYARDTRPSGNMLLEALEDGLKAIGAIGRNEGIQTTPVLHYLVRCVNTKGTKEHYGEDSVQGYYTKISKAFKALMASKPPAQPLLVDCANGVGAQALEKAAPYLKPAITFIPMNTEMYTRGALNNGCGADFVKTQQRLPPSLRDSVKPNQRACSFDGDADRIIYFYHDEMGNFRLLDGDKIAGLVASFIVELVKGAGLEGKLGVGVVQTAYANGASTKFLTERELPVTCVATGVKHLHRAAEKYDVGVYFEANGHGTVLFSPKARATLEEHAQTLKDSPSTTTPTTFTHLNNLMHLTELINETVGDAFSDMLLVEVILAHKAFSGGVEWDSLYTDLPNRLVKAHVKDRSAFVTTDQERRLLEPRHIQPRIDVLVKKYEAGRAFVRPSGTEDVVRIYAEAARRAEADELATKVSAMVQEPFPDSF